MANEGARSGWWRGGRLALLAGAGAVILALALLVAKRPASAAPIKMTAGAAGTSRDLVARGLAHRLSAHGVEVEVVAVPGDELARVEDGTVDVALVSAVTRPAADSRIREVAPLHVEGLHLLVKSELAGSVGPALAGLQGRRVDVGATGTGSASLSTAVLSFAGLGGAGGAIVEHMPLDELERRIAAGDRDGLPDAVFHLATVPSRIALDLVRSADFQLLPLPFADAFRLGTLLQQAESRGREEPSLDLTDVGPFQIPAFTYRTDPPLPANPLPTLGALLLLVAHERVPAETVEQLLETVYGTQFARLAHPPLERRALERRPQLHLHPGTTAFLAHDQPLLSAGDVDELNNTLGVFGALLGGGLFLWQGIRQARASRRDRIFGDHMLRVAGVEQRLVEIELSSQLELDVLISLQNELLELKRETLTRFASGQLGDHRALAELLAPVDVARDHVAAMLLHVRERIEDRAGAEGRTAAAVWNEEAAATTDTE